MSTEKILQHFAEHLPTMRAAFGETTNFDTLIGSRFIFHDGVATIMGRIDSIQIHSKNHYYITLFVSVPRFKDAQLLHLGYYATNGRWVASILSDSGSSDIINGEFELLD
ncbi:MAG: hypothetical protein Q7S16_04315 [bacterium]|nr:hypothetical protein [bacterium]